MLGGQNNKADQLMSSQFLTIRLGWLHTRHRAVNQDVNFYFPRKRKTAISPPILSPFQFFFFQELEIILRAVDNTRNMEHSGTSRNME